MMRTRTELESLLEHPNVAAFLRVIREGESSQEERGYRLRYPNTEFDDLSRHPQVRVPLPDGRYSTAAGAYQFTWTTWQEVAIDRLGLTSFTPMEQDLACVALLDQLGAIGRLMTDDFVGALRAAGPRWSSLPTGTTNERKISFQRAYEVYQKYGGGSQTQPPAPVEEIPAMPAAALIPFGIALVQSLIEAFSPLAREKISKELQRHNAAPDVANQVASSVLEVAKQITNKVDPVAAVAEVKADPVKAAAVESTALEEISRLQPLLDRAHEMTKDEWSAEESSRNAAAARARGEAVDLAPLLAVAGLAIFAVSLVGLGIMMILNVALVKDAGVMRELHNGLLPLFALLVGIVGTKVMGTLYDYRFGTSRSSEAKNLALEQVAIRSGR